MRVELDVCGSRWADQLLIGIRVGRRRRSDKAENGASPTVCRRRPCTAAVTAVAAVDDDSAAAAGSGEVACRCSGRELSPRL